MGQKDIEKVKTVVLGCGMISTIYLKNLTNLFYIIDLIAVSDVDKDRAEACAKAYGVQVMTMDEICSSDEIELVINLTPPYLHYTTTYKLLEAGKNVFSEKVLCTDFEKGKELVALAEKKGLYLGVAPETFLGAGLQTARRILDSGLIGKPTSCYATLNRDMAVLSENFTYIQREGGCLVSDVGCYYLTALTALLGAVEQVTGFGETMPVHTGQMFWMGNYMKEFDCPGNNIMAASMKFKSGVLGSFHVNGVTISEEQSGQPSIVIYGTDGILQLGDPNNFDGKVTWIGKSGEQADVPFTHGYKGTPVYGEPTPYDYGGHRGIGAAEMAWSMRKGRKNRASKELALHVLELIEGMDQSSRNKEVYTMTTTIDRPDPLPAGYMTEILPGMRGDAEMSLVL